MIKQISSPFGFSLIEMLLALAISMSFMLILSYSYMTIRRLYQLNQNTITMQNNAFIAQQILSRDIRSAGFIGCARLSSNKELHHPANVDLTIESRVHGYSSNNLPAEMKFAAKDIVPDTDIIVIEKMANEISWLKDINSRKKYNSLQLLMISDCTNRTIFLFTQNNFIQQLKNKNDFSSVAQIAPLEKIAFYIASTERTTSTRAPLYALYKKDLWGDEHQQTEIVDGIENMQIRYGDKSPYSNQIHYFTADQIRDWSQVSVIKIDLLLVSMQSDNYIHQATQYMGTALTTNDNRTRREWVFNVRLREL